MKSDTMKAIVVTGYGGPEVLEYREVAAPSPSAKEVLVEVQATTVTAADTMMRRATPAFSRLFLGLTKPNKPIIGTGFAGKVVHIGDQVTKFEVGDRVFGETGVNFSANAEYVSVAEDAVISLIPANMSYEEAAPLCDGAMTSMNFLTRIAKVGPGQKVLINGASGSLGTAAVQIAKYYGAEVTGVCGPNNIELVRSLGADHVINYREQEFTKSGEQYDLIYDTVGKSSFGKAKRALKNGGSYLSPVLKLPLLFQVLWTANFGKKKAKFSATGLKPAAELQNILEELKQLIETGHLKMVIDKRYPLAQAAEAHQYVDTGHKKGNLILFI